MTETTAPTKQPVGRPSDYNSEIAETICQRLADGISLREICRADDMPDKTTVLRWLNNFPEFRTQYQTAREMLVEHWAEDLIEIADDGTNDWVERQGKDGSTHTAFDSEHVQRSKLRVDTRKWLMSKMLPKKYGDKVDVSAEITGKDGAPLIDLPSAAAELAAIYAKALKGT